MTLFRRHRWLGLCALAVIFGSVLAVVRRTGHSAQGPAPQHAADRAMPVGAATARSADLPVTLDGLGTVTSLNTVVVKSRVDGQILHLRFREGQHVREGDVLAELDPRPFEVQLLQAQGQRARDEATLQNAEVDLKRYQALVADDAIPRQQLDTQAATVAQYAAAVQSDDAQIASARLNLTYSRITAPAPGQVGLKQVDQGNIVHATDANGVVVITQLQPITVVFTLPADQLPQVLERFHRSGRLVVEAYDRDFGRKLAEGELLAVDNQIDPATGTVKLKATFVNHDDALYPNQFVNARLRVDTLRNAVVVPAAAIQPSSQGAYVYRVKKDQTVEVVDVVVRLNAGDDAAIEKGLSAGDVVVVDGVDKLRAGSKVAVSLPAGKNPGA